MLKLKTLFLCLLTLSLVQGKNDYHADSSDVSGDRLVTDVTYKGNFRLTDYLQDNINPAGECEPITNLRAEFTLEHKDIVHVKITDSERERWQAEQYVVDPSYEELRDTLTGSQTLQEAGLRVTASPFSFEFVSPKTERTLYSWRASQKFLYSDNLIIYSADISGWGVYGLGERVHGLKLREGLYTILPHDTAGTPTDDNLGGRGTYSSAPFYFFESYKEEFFGVLLVNTNFQDYSLRSDYGIFNVETRLLGGIIDLYFFRADELDTLIKIQQSIIGKPALPPYWSLGWHQCRYGYNSTQDLRDTIANYQKFDLPLDTLWTDIEYMKYFANFTIDDQNWGDLPAFVDQIHKDHLHFIPILDLGIPIRDDDEAYSEGKRLDLFIQSNYTETDLVQPVWPGNCVFVDWLNPKSEAYWAAQLERFNKKLDFDGIWLDMNEPASLNEEWGSGEIADSKPVEKNAYHKIPYLPGNRRVDMNSKTISANALNYGYSKKSFMTQYNTRVLNAYLENISTLNYLNKTNPDKRAFILTRSAQIGLGKHSAHWLGDNYSTWESMRLNLPGIMSYGFFGYTMVGVDVCGFVFDSWDSLCARWHVIGAFNPFSRNHNTIRVRSQEPYAFGEDSLTLKAFRAAIPVRYSILRYFLTEMFNVHTEGGIFYRPLFYDFKVSDESYFFEDSQVMIGDSFLFVPCLTDHTYEFKAFFPEDGWVHFPSGKPVGSYPFAGETKSGSYHMVPAGWSDVNIFLRKGRIVPYQREKAKNVNQLENSEMGLFINLFKGKAKGKLVYAKEGYIKSVQEDSLVVTLTATSNLITVSSKGFAYEKKDVFLKYIHIAQNTSVAECEVKGAECSVNTTGNLTLIEFSKNLDLRENHEIRLITADIA